MSFAQRRWAFRPSPSRSCRRPSRAWAWPRRSSHGVDPRDERGAGGRTSQGSLRADQACPRIIPYYRVYSVSPHLLHAHLDFYAAVGAPGALSKLRKELIATAVSADNGCRHCTQLHAGFLGKLTTDEGLVRALMTDPAAAPLHGADRALIAYALKLTRTPREVRESDVAALRAAGFS